MLHIKINFLFIYFTYILNKMSDISLISQFINKIYYNSLIMTIILANIIIYELF